MAKIQNGRLPDTNFPHNFTRRSHKGQLLWQNIYESKLHFVKEFDSLRKMKILY